jgi:RimJ/RimL family protein N-acetyltransferase
VAAGSVTNSTAGCLQSARVLLRPWTLDDAPELLAALDESREHFFPWLRFASRLRTLDDCRDHIVRGMADRLRGEAYSFAIVAPPNLAPPNDASSLVGGIDLFQRDLIAGGYSIGYWLRLGATGQGYMTAAVRLVTAYALDELRANRVEIMCDVRNTGSAAVAERLGFAREGGLRDLRRAPDGRLATMLVYSLIPSDPRGVLDAPGRGDISESLHVNANGGRIMAEGSPESPLYRTLIALPDELQGERVIVRPYRLDDAPALREAVDESREHVRPWLPFADFHRTVEESRDWIARQMAAWLLRENFSMSIWERGSGRYLGGVGLHVRDWESGHFEIGYWLRKSAEGHGYMAEAVRLVIELGVQRLRSSRLQIRCDARNARSAAVAERLGFTREAHLRNDMRGPTGELRDTLVFGLIAGDAAWPPAGA